MKKILLCLLLLLSLSACNKEKDKNGGTVVTPPKKNNGGDVVEPVKGYVDYHMIFGTVDFHNKISDILLLTLKTVINNIHLLSLSTY